jgi:hypothetical protein
MSSCAKEGASLDCCVAIASSACRRAAGSPVRCGRGRRPEVPDWIVAVMVVIAVLHRKKTRQAQYAFWRARREQWEQWFPEERLLSRSQFYERARRLTPLLQRAIRRLAAHAVRRGWADAQSVAIDKSFLAARGKKRPYRKPGPVRGVDLDAAWGYGDHDGWVFGYSYEVVVSAGKQGVEWPLAASVDAANRSELRSCFDKLDQLPAVTKYVLADSGYDSNAVGEAVERQADGRPTGRRFVCPEIPRPQVGRTRQSSSRESLERQRHRRLRDARRKFTQSVRGRRLYRRRKVTVEPFNSRFKHAFDLNDRVWHWKLLNNRIMILAAMVAYQVLLTYNHQRRQPHARVFHLINAW